MVCQLLRAVEDVATVKIYYENRFVKLDILYPVLSELDDEFEEIMEGQEEMTVERTKKGITKMEATISSQNRIRTLTSDYIEHWKMRRNNAFGKCMIVAMYRRICVDLYNEIVSLRPE